MRTAEEKLEEMTALNNHMGKLIEREINARMGRHAAKRTITKVQKACKVLAKPVPDKTADPIAWQADHVARKQARKVLRAAGGIVR